MKLRIAIAMTILGILSLCSVVSSRETNVYATTAFGGGGLPTPCFPPSSADGGTIPCPAIHAVQK